MVTSTLKSVSLIRAIEIKVKKANTNLNKIRLQ